MRLVIVIPAYNEAGTITKVINKIPESFAGVDRVITLVVDDGSSDQTAALAKLAGADVISHPQNLGVGSAFSTGLKKTLELGGDIMINIDADGQFSPDDIPRLIEPILQNKADFVSGDRFSDSNGNFKKPPNMSPIKYWGNKRMSELISMLTDKEFNDVSCGFRAYSREALLQLNLIGNFTYTQETFIDLGNKGLTIKTIPVDVKYFKDRKSRVANNILKYMVRTGKIIFRAYRDYKPLRFFGWLGLVNFLMGSAFATFSVVHYAQTGAFSPYKSIGFLAIYFVSLALLFWIVGLLADMFVRVRLNQEKILYFEKKRQYKKEK